MNWSRFNECVFDHKRWHKAIKRSTAVRAATALALGNIGVEYAAGHDIKPLCVSSIFALLATVITKTFDEDLQADIETPAPPPSAPAA